MNTHRIVITGASQGIGAAIAHAFAELGSVSLALVARNRVGLDETAEICRNLGAEVLVVPCDVTKDLEVEAMARQVAGSMGTPTAIVNNAGAFEPGGVLDGSADWFRFQLDANLTSAFLVTRAFLPAMVKARQGHLLFMGSTASIKGYPSGAAYCAAKHGLLGLARALRAEMMPHDIRVTTLLPGATYTPSWEGSSEPESRFMPAEDIAAAVVSAYSMTGRSVVEEILIRPQLGDL